MSHESGLLPDADFLIYSITHTDDLRYEAALFDVRHQKFLGAETTTDAARHEETLQALRMGLCRMRLKVEEVRTHDP